MVIGAQAWVAPTAVISGDVSVGPHSRILHGAVLTADGGPVTLGEHCVVMEGAVLRGTRADRGAQMREAMEKYTRGLGQLRG